MGHAHVKGTDEKPDFLTDFYVWVNLYRQHSPYQAASYLPSQKARSGGSFFMPGHTPRRLLRRRPPILLDWMPGHSRRPSCRGDRGPRKHTQSFAHREASAGLFARDRRPCARPFSPAFCRISVHSTVRRLTSPAPAARVGPANNGKRGGLHVPTG